MIVSSFESGQNTKYCISMNESKINAAVAGTYSNCLECIDTIYQHIPVIPCIQPLTNLQTGHSVNLKKTPFL